MIVLGRWDRYWSCLISIKRTFDYSGAVSAVIILIFRDTILGFVSSVQVSINDMVRIGDWITMDKFGADGDVEINLATVKFVRQYHHYDSYV
jgi:miniconductance mechanosensitive channel